jgi:hypothetical protein
MKKVSALDGCAFLRVTASAAVFVSVSACGDADAGSADADSTSSERGGQSWDAAQAECRQIAKSEGERITWLQGRGVLPEGQETKTYLENNAVAPGETLQVPLRITDQWGEDVVTFGVHFNAVVPPSDRSFQLVPFSVSVSCDSSTTHHPWFNLYRQPLEDEPGSITTIGTFSGGDFKAVATESPASVWGQYDPIHGESWWGSGKYLIDYDCPTSEDSATVTITYKNTTNSCVSFGVSAALNDHEGWVLQ